MFFFNEKLKKIIKDYFNMTEDMVSDMEEMYLQKIFAMMVNNALEYLESHQLAADLKKLDELTSNPSQDTKIIEQIVQFIFKIYQDYPEAEKIFLQKQKQLNDDLNRDLINSLDEKTVVKILEVAKEDADDVMELEKFITQARSKLPEKSESN